MQRIFWIGHDYFQASMQALDYEVHFFSFTEFDVFNWENIVSIAGYEPDIVVVADKSLPPFVLGIEQFPCITVFYAVDTHIHSWFPLYAQAFDICLVSLHDHVQFFQCKNLPSERIHWFPPFARDDDAPNLQVEPKWDCLFVGSANVENLPKRLQFLEKLSNLVSLHITQGKYAKLFPYGRVLINHCENDDLNFRVFEALGCGGVLVTPQVGHGLNKLFNNGEELVTYEAGNVYAAAIAIKKLLDSPSVCKNMAKNGLMAVDAKHRARHRAKQLSDLLNSIDNNKIIAQRLKNSLSIRKTWLRQIYLLFADVMQDEGIKAAYLKAAQ